MIDTAQLWSAADLPGFLLEMLQRAQNPWKLLQELDHFMAGVQDSRAGSIHPNAVVEGSVWLAEGARIGPGALVQGPAWIGAGAEVGHAAYVRGGAILAAGAKVGHSSEVKRSILFPQAKLPHFNYAGDSVIGSGANLGAGVKIANFNAFGNGVRVAGGSGLTLRKAGALLGDGVSIGCNAVLAPGTVVGARTVIYNGANIRGVVPPDSVVKVRTTLDTVPRD